MAIQPVEQGSAFAFRNVINNNFYELKVLSGASKPTQSTAAVVGQMYLDTSEGKMYFCSNVSGSVYTWKPFASDMSASNVSYNNDSSGMSSDNVQDAIDELFTSASNGKELIADAITGMGVSTSADDTYATMAENIEKIETGIDISDATLTAASELKKDIVAYSKTGKRIVGSLGQGTVNKPSISVSSAGKITASTSYTSGIIGQSTVSNTYQLSTQSGTTITPGTSQITAVATGKYTTGPVYVAGDEDLKASNIKSGVSIFGVNGNLKEGYKYATASPNVGMWSDSDDSLKVTFSSALNDLNKVIAIIGSFCGVQTSSSREFFNEMVSVVCGSDNTGEYKIIYDYGDGTKLQKTDTLTYSHRGAGTFLLNFNQYPFSNAPDDVFSSEFVIIYQ